MTASATFSEEEIARMSPAVRAEIQELLLRRFFARQVKRTPERRKSRQPQWPHRSGVWPVHDSERAYIRRMTKAQ